MGLLDDAIREHLDLKRRRGADPSEVERAEREALGPVRRVQPQGDGELEEGAELREGELAAPVGVEDPDERWSHDEDPLGGDDVAEPASALDQQTAVHQPDFDDDEPFADGEPFADEEPLAEEPPAQRPAQAPPPHPAGGETVEYDSEAAPPAPAEGEDVLEETPEFLQDTPDHDRLWFEQRPPKDFDFDG